MPQPYTLFAAIWSGVTAAQSAPADTAVPAASGSVDANGLRGTEFTFEYDLTVTSGTATAVIRYYVWDPVRRVWVRSDNTTTVVSSATTAGAASRSAYEVASIEPYGGILPVLESITAAIGATITCQAAAR